MGQGGRLFVTKKAKNIIEHFYLHNLVFYLQILFMGQWIVSTYIMVLPMVLFTLMPPNSYGPW
jgi:hypothetical protein